MIVHRRQEIVYLSPECPISVNWMRGYFTKSSSLRYHSAIEFQYFRQGKGTYIINGKRYPFVRNSLLVIKPNEVHCYVPCPGSYMEKCSVLFAPDYKVNRRPAVIPSELLRYYKLLKRETTIIEMILYQISEELNARSLYYTDIIRAHWAVFICLLKRAGQRRDTTPPKHNTLVDSLVGYLENNYTRDITLASLAVEFGYSEGHLSHLFKRHIGISIKQYMLQRRIVEAKRFLDNEPALKVAAVAERVGFKDITVFFHDFKKIAGLSASQYRRISNPKISY